MDKSLERNTYGTFKTGVWLVIISFAVGIILAVFNMVFPFISFEDFDSAKKIVNIQAYSHAISYLLCAIGYALIAYKCENFYIKTSAIIFIATTLMNYVSNIIGYNGLQSYIFSICFWILNATGLGILCCSPILRDNLRRIIVLAVGIYAAYIVIVGWFSPEPISLDFYILIQPMQGILGSLTALFSIAASLALISMWYQIGKLYEIGIEENGDTKDRLVAALTSRYVIAFISIVIISRIVYYFLWNLLF